MVRIFLSSAHLIDLIVIFTLIEGVILYLWHRRTGRGLPSFALTSMLLPGLFLLLALRAALAGAAWPWVPAALAAALFAHLVDLAGRSRR